MTSTMGPWSEILTVTKSLSLEWKESAKEFEVNHKTALRRSALPNDWGKDSRGV
jgi:hypothetical protein